VAETASAKPAPAALARRDRIVVIGCAVALTALAWLYLVRLARTMPMDAMADMPMSMAMPMPAAWSHAELAFLFWMWLVMMVGMMAPAAAPVMLLFAAAQTRQNARGARLAVGLFALGYAIVWTGFSAVAALAQWTLHAFAMLSPAMAASSAHVAGAILLVAGVYQLLPLKSACLSRCRSPIGFLMTRWRDGRLGALEMGVRHGAWCLGCCFALMTILFAVGVMNLVFVAALALFVLLEKTGPAGLLVARAGGVLLLAAGAFMLVTG
jgi:predicted metal-binding membrane protein